MHGAGMLGLARPCCTAAVSACVEGTKRKGRLRSLLRPPCIPPCMSLRVLGEWGGVPLEQEEIHAAPFDAYRAPQAVVAVARSAD